MAKYYYVDWDDEHYPAIRLWTEATPEYWDRLTFAGAKAEIYEKMRSRARDAHEFIKEVRTWRAKDIEE